MSYYPDLSPYVYAGAIPGAVNVGWLDSKHDFPKGKVPVAVIRKLKNLMVVPAVRHRGYHNCEFCGALAALRWSQKERRSNAVITVHSKDNRYALRLFLRPPSSCIAGWKPQKLVRCHSRAKMSGVLQNRLEFPSPERTLPIFQ